MAAAAPAALQGLRCAIAEIEGNPCSLNGGRQALAFGVDAIDVALGGGFAFGALHELSPSMPSCIGAVTGFALTLAARIDGSKQVLLIQSTFASCEAGSLYAPGLALFGLPLRRVLMLRVTRPIDVLWAMEEALKCPAVACVIAELPNDGSVADLTATRRLSLAAREGGGFGFLFRHRPSPFASAAETRWKIAAAESPPDRFDGLGRAAFSLSLTKNRRGPTGCWTVAWDHNDRVFSALSFGVVEKVVDRSRRTLLARAG